MAGNERLELHFAAKPIDDRKRGFQDAMAAKDERIGGERLAQDGQIAIFTEQRGEVVGFTSSFSLLVHVAPRSCS